MRLSISILILAISSSLVFAQNEEVRKESVRMNILEPTFKGTDKSDDLTAFIKENLCKLQLDPNLGVGGAVMVQFNVIPTGNLTDIRVIESVSPEFDQSVISTLGASVDYVVVSDLQNDTFFAKLYIILGKEQMEIDSRPSDALALAVRVGAPIYAESEVLDKAGIILEEETGKPTSERRVDDKELKGLSAYEDFINTLDLDDFNKRKS